MAGYADYSMSNNAVDAYRSGLAPASKIGIPDELLDKYCPTDEWHHSSKAYNRVYFYNVRKARVMFGLEKPNTKGDDGADSDGYEPDPAAIEGLAEWRREKRTEVPEVYAGCTVKWIDWEGSLRKPKAYPQEVAGCLVSVKSYTATVFLPSGRNFTKRTYTNGFEYRGGTEIDPATFNEAHAQMIAEHDAKVEAERLRAAAEAEASRLQWEADAPKRAAAEAAAAARWLKGARRRETMALKKAAAAAKLAEDRAAAARAEDERVLRRADVAWGKLSPDVRSQILLRHGLITDAKRQRRLMSDCRDHGIAFYELHKFRAWLTERSLANKATN